MVLFCSPPFIKYAFNIGVSESDTKAEISTAAPMTTPNSRNNRPTNPSKKIIGKNTAAKVIEIEITAKKISFEPLIAASMGDMPSSTFLKMFSVTTIPSSTTNPVANTMANSVKTLIENPHKYMMKNVAINDTGISISGRNAMAQFLKNKKMIKTTSMIDINNVSATSTTDFLMNNVLSSAISNLISEGRSFLSWSYCL